LGFFPPQHKSPSLSQEVAFISNTHHTLGHPRHQTTHDKKQSLLQIHAKLTDKMSDNADMKVSNVRLLSNDGATLTIDRAVAERSVLIKNLIEDLGDEAVVSEPIPIPNVNEPVLRKVVEWCEKHKSDTIQSTEEENENRKKMTEIDEWDQKFMQVDQEMLFEIILAANYLDIKALLDVGCKTVANMIKGKSPEEIRKTFNITNDFTPEEEEQIRRENEWAEDR